LRAFLRLSRRVRTPKSTIGVCRRQTPKQWESGRIAPIAILHLPTSEEAPSFEGVSSFVEEGENPQVNDRSLPKANSQAAGEPRPKSCYEFRRAKLASRWRMFESLQRPSSLSPLHGREEYRPSRAPLWESR